MKIAIVGAGMTGAYLYRLLRRQAQEIDIFDRDPGTSCGLTPCAWGTSRGFAELVKAAGLDAEKYFLRTFDYVVMDGIRIKADLATFHKPRLVRDLLQGAELKPGPFPGNGYDRIIDATGVSRGLLPPLNEDILLSCVQWRIMTDAEMENRINLGKIGYAWCFPLSQNEYHVGCGSLISEPGKLMAELGWLRNISPPGKGKILCGCRGKIRLAAPLHARPFVKEDGPAPVWGVGESIGCVAPLAGDGIVPGMKSVRILLDCWGDAGRYEEAILREFRWMKDERAVIDKLRGKEALGVKDAWVLKKNSRRMGMQVGLKEAFQLLKHLR